MTQLTYNYLATPTDPDVQFVLDALSVYFRNWWSPENPNREDGFRKPEELGISPGGREIEIIEVKPQGRYQEGVDQLNVMIPKIKDGLSSYYKEKSLSTGSCPSFNPDTLSRRSQAGALVAENPLLFGVIPPSLLYHHGLHLKIGFARTFRHLSYKKRSRDLDRQQQRGI